MIFLNLTNVAMAHHNYTRLNVRPLVFTLYTTHISSLISSLPLNHHALVRRAQLFVSFKPNSFTENISHPQKKVKRSVAASDNHLTVTGNHVPYMGSHSVTYHPAAVTFPPYPDETGTRFSDPGGTQG